MTQSITPTQVIVARQNKVACSPAISWNFNINGLRSITMSEVDLMYSPNFVINNSPLNIF